MKFEKWLDTFVEEREFDTEEIIFEGEDKLGTLHIIDLGYLVEVIKTATQLEKSKIKDMIVKLDFLNGDIKHFFQYLAKGYVENL
jgi:hypothetical protein